MVGPECENKRFGVHYIISWFYNGNPVLGALTLLSGIYQAVFFSHLSIRRTFVIFVSAMQA